MLEGGVDGIAVTKDEGRRTKEEGRRKKEEGRGAGKITHRSEAMRRLLVIVAVLSIAGPLHAQSRSMLDTPVSGRLRVMAERALDPCGTFTAIEQIARQARLHVGMEHPPECRGFTQVNEVCDATGREVQVLDGLTPRQALDYVIGLTRQYRWREVDGVIVVRPAAAWAEGRGHLLNRRVPAFELSSVHLSAALDLILQTADPALSYPHRAADPNGRPIDRLVTIAFPGGTVMDALNAAARAHGNTMWLLHSSDDLAMVWFFPRDLSMGAVAAPLAVSASARERSQRFAARTGVSS